MTIDVTFPRERFEAAGGSVGELDALEAEFRRSDAVAQSAMTDYWATVSVGDLVEYLANLRDAGHFTEVPADDDEATTTDEADTTGTGESMAAPGAPASDRGAPGQVPGDTEPPATLTTDDPAEGSTA